MARPQKVGLDYFPLDTVLDTKFELIEAEFGLTGFGVIVKLLQKIYGEQGYYIEWTSEVALLFSRRIAVGGNVVSEIVETSINRGIFDRDKFQKYHILTSNGIQERYLQAVNRRNISIKDEYSLLKCTQIAESDTKTGVNVCNNSVNVSNNAIKKTKENKSKVNNTKPKETKVVVVDCYEQNIGIVPKAVYDDISALIESDIESDLLCECIKIAVFNGKPQWNYVKGIVKNLLSRDIKTLLEFKSANSKGKHTQSTSYDIAGLDEFWNTVPKLEGQND